MRGPLLYPYAAVKTLFRFVPPEVTIDHDEGRFEGPVMLALFANGSRFGGGMRIAPGASLEDGLLDMVLVPKVSRLRLLGTLPRVYSGSHVRSRSVSIRKIRSATLSSPSPVTVWADGEPVLEADGAPITLTTMPGALLVAAQPEVQG